MSPDPHLSSYGCAPCGIWFSALLSPSGTRCKAVLAVLSFSLLRMYPAHLHLLLIGVVCLRTSFFVIFQGPTGLGSPGTKIYKRTQKNPTKNNSSSKKPNAASTNRTRTHTLRWWMHAMPPSPQAVPCLVIFTWPKTNQYAMNTMG